MDSATAPINDSPAGHTDATGRRDRVARFLPEGAVARRFVAISLVDSIGTGLFLAGSALFFLRALRLSPAHIGLGLTLGGVAGLVFSMPIGHLAERLGARRTIVVLQLWRGVWFLVYPFASNFAVFLIAACAVGAAEFSVGPIVQSVLGAEKTASHARTMAFINSVRNVGFSVGALLATIAIATNTVVAFRALVVADAASFFGAALLVMRIRLDQPTTPLPGPRIGAFRYLRDANFVTLASLNGVLFLHTVILSVGIPLWIVTHTRAPHYLAGGIVLLNTVLAVTLQVRLSRGADDISHAARKQRVAGRWLGAACLLIAVGSKVPGWLAAVLLIGAGVLLTLGEICQVVSAWGLSFALSPEEHRTGYLSAYNLGATGATVLGPALLTSAVVRAGFLGWAGLGVVFLGTGAAVPIFARRAQRSAPNNQ